MERITNETANQVLEPATRIAFSIVENPGVYALLLGSGVSRAAEIPTGWEVTLDLVRRMAAVEGVTDRVDWAAWHLERFGTDPGYSQLLDALSVTPTERRSVLHHYIEPTAEDLDAGRRVPTRAHHAIARLVRDGWIRVIVTTNFDRLLETALKAVGVEPVVIASVDDLSGASPLPHCRCLILKVHGDYLDNRILNTDAELASYPAEYDRLLDRILDEYGLIVLGWSGEWDPALRAAVTRAPSRRYPTWWASRGEPGPAASDLIARRAATMVPVANADTFFCGLADAVDVLAKSRRPSPDTIELLLATTKRNLSNPERRIDLADAFAEQADKVATRLRGDEFPVTMQVTNDVLIERWKAIESLSEPLARMVGLAGRWGDGTEFGIVEDVVRSLVSDQPGNGNTALIGLATYPAYLAYLTYGLGLTKAQRWGDLFRWLTIELAWTFREPVAATRSLFMSFWNGVESAWWKFWPDLDRRKTPWADHLVDAVVPWSRDYGLSGEAAVENYRTLELLGGFAFLTGESEQTLQQLQDFTWMPYGQTIAWADDARERIIKRLEGPALQPKLFAAGFSNGSAAHWEGVKRNIGLLARKVSW
ncbi:SIR2 family protein [Novosphingobium album (ex Liu et al. 2023)]|uniref:SIR2 family protein n=1 Tax=Novosphingobium album (ex Liu et al. 2023) TaxID=3031130 RepID=UPI0023B139C6|nr:SIR2 family protein [Novosphingobium album (ex Liu et al. 2023)]